MLKQIVKKSLILLLGEKRYLRLSWLFKYGPKYYRMWCYQEIGGWRPEKEAIALYQIAVSLPDEHPVVVEIGSWLGKSSVILALGIRKKISACLYCIDPFDAGGDDRSVVDYEKIKENITLPLKEVFVNNMKTYGVYKYIEILKGHGYDFIKGWDRPIDFLFIDGDHSYEAVLQDYQLWSRFIKPGGYIVLDDVVIELREDCPIGPGRVVRECLLNNPEWEGKRLVGFLFIARKV